MGWQMHGWDHQCGGLESHTGQFHVFDFRLFLRLANIPLTKMYKRVAGIIEFALSKKSNENLNIWQLIIAY